LHEHTVFENVFIFNYINRRFCEHWMFYEWFNHS